MRMSPEKVLALVALVGVCALLLVATSSVQAQEAEAAAGRASFKLPKVFDFESYKSLFKRKYSSLVEEVARRKLFLARAFRAFLSAIGYKHHRSNSYLAINHMSDWTPKEVKQLYVRAHNRNSFFSPEDVDDGYVAPPEEPAHDDMDDMADRGSAAPAPLADIEDIQRELADIIARKDERPEFAEIAEELPLWQDNLVPTRRKRDAGAQENEAAPRHITVDDLIRADVSADEPAEVKAKMVRKLDSNNPEYQAPELESQAVAGGAEQVPGHVEPLAEEEASMFANVPGGQYIDMAMRSASSFFTKFLLGVGEKQAPTHMRINVGAPRPDAVHYDHRKSHCFLQPRNQGNCGSCYIFSTTALYEYVHCKQTGELVAFSEQYMLDCGHWAGMKGCDGGLEPKVARYIATFGLELRTNYPYREKQEECPYRSPSEAHTMGFLKTKEPALKMVSEHELEKYAVKTPILIGLAVDDNFGEYGGGVDDLAKCNYDNGHSMLLVGSGVQDGKEYWLIRNSYSVRWGEGGYYKLSKKTPCFLHGSFISKADWEGKKLSEKNHLYDGSAVRRRYGSYMANDVSKLFG